MTGIITIIMVFSIPLAGVIGHFIHEGKKLDVIKGGDSESLSDLRKQVGSLMAENEEMKERLKNVESILGNDSQRMKLDYEKEQILLDQNNKSIYK